MEAKGGVGCCLCTFARFFLHSVQALGVTTPRPRRRLEAAEPGCGPGRCCALGVVEAVEEESPVCMAPAPAAVGVPEDAEAAVTVAGVAPVVCEVEIED